MSSSVVSLKLVTFHFVIEIKFPAVFMIFIFLAIYYSNKKGILVLDLKTRTLNFRKIPIWWRNYRNKEV